MSQKEPKPTQKLGTTKRRKLILLTQRYARFLKSKYEVKRVILIGSLVKGFFHDRSDIDLVAEGLAPELYIKALTELYGLLPEGAELNLIPYEDAFVGLKDKSIREEKLIYR